jgi:hypothetical protein
MLGRNPFGAVAVATAVAFAAQPLHAAVSAIGIGDFSPSASFEDFSSLPSFTEVHGLTIGGLTFGYSLGAGQVSIATGPGPTNNMSDPNVITLGDASGTLTISLAAPAVQFGYAFALLSGTPVPQGTTAELFSGATSVGSLSFDGLPDPTFAGGYAGIQSTLPFDRVVLSFAAGLPAWAVDNMRVTAVPEPSTVAMWGLGLLALLSMAGRAPKRRPGA